MNLKFNSLKSVFLSLVIIGWGLSAWSAPRFQCALNSEISREDSLPWPWGSEIQMPWNSLEGVWKVISEDCESYFSFVSNGKDMTPSKRVINITQYDTVSCRRISWGYGFESNRILRASMTDGRGTFNLTVRAFDHRSGPAHLTSQKGRVEPVMVLTMYSKRGWQYRKSFEIRKVSQLKTPVCK